MYPSLRANEVALVGQAGDEIEGYLAVPGNDGPFPGVVVLHHMLGLDESTMEVVRRFAAHGFAALCPNLHAREAAGGVSVEDAAAACRAAGGVPDVRLVGDVEGSMRYLASTLGCPKIGVIGYCSGGRQAFLAATALDLDAAIDCYGSFVNNAPPATIPLKVQPVLPLADRLRCPLLAIFGDEDPNPSPADAAEIASELERLGKTYEAQSYEGAGHGFFDTSAARYHPAAARDGWERVLEFFSRWLTG